MVTALRCQQRVIETFRNIKKQIFQSFRVVAVIIIIISSFQFPWQYDAAAAAADDDSNNNNTNNNKLTTIIII